MSANLEQHNDRLCVLRVGGVLKKSNSASGFEKIPLFVKKKYRWDRGGGGDVFPTPPTKNKLRPPRRGGGGIFFIKKAGARGVWRRR